jgi:hypothetical protein
MAQVNKVKKWIANPTKKIKNEDEIQVRLRLLNNEPTKLIQNTKQPWRLIAI